MRSIIFQFLETHRVMLFRLYIILVILLVVLPLNGQEKLILNNIFIIEIRLDHLLHGVLFVPWFFISVRIRRLPVWVSIIVGIGLVVGAEGVQYYLPYRAFNINDMISNVIGMMLGLGVMGRLRDGGTKRLRDVGTKRRRD